MAVVMLRVDLVHLTRRQCGATQIIIDAVTLKEAAAFERTLVPVKDRFGTGYVANRSPAAKVTPGART